MLLSLSSLESEGSSELQKNSQAGGDSEVFGVPLFCVGSESGTESVAKTIEKSNMVRESGFAEQPHGMAHNPTGKCFLTKTV